MSIITKTLALTLLLAISHRASAKDCAVGKNGGFSKKDDHPGDAAEMKKLVAAFNYGKPKLLESMCNAEGVCCVKGGGGNRVVELYWERSKIEGSFPDTFYKMDEMVNLDFHLNFIKHFPSNLTAMPKLQTAQFGRNPICGQIPKDWKDPGFGKQLAKLNCNFCCLSGRFPDMFNDLPNLEEFFW
jgi:hypothetical protein